MATKPIEILIQAKSTGDAEIDALNKRLEDLASQQELIDSFVRIKKETQQAALAFGDAQAKAQQLGREIAASGQPTKQQANEFARARVEVNGTKEAYQGAQLKLQGLRGALKENNIETTGLVQKQAALRAGMRDVETSVASASGRLKDLGSVGPKAVNETATATDRAAGSAKGYQGALSQIAGAVAGAFAINKVADFAKSVGEISDQYKNLQARIQLVTGEGDNFTASWQGITDVTLRTHSSLEETGTLFTRLAQAGKDAGLATAAASEQALALTETINQAVQLSGASAQASSAAITQLVQGLQGGVLRGDEFNSVMEQSPRLARALADGLGVTTGELRKMAEAGTLTSQTVIGALKGQSDAVASEFSKLPPTVGRAMQDLTTQWTLYIAETDKASGASTAAATVITALASNLNAIAGVLVDVGQAGAGFLALKLAQNFLSIGAAAQTATIAIAATNAQIVATNTVATSATAAAGRFATILGGLRTFTLIGLVTNFKDIGTWVGEGVAKLAGFKDRTEELARAEQVQLEITKDAAAGRARLAAAIQSAIDKQFELSKAAKLGVAEFEKLTKEGASSAEALAKVAGSFSTGSVEGIKNFAAVLDKLTADAKVSAGEVEAAWAKALSGADLAKFEVLARTAFSGTAREGERVAQTMDAILREAVKRTGVEFEVLQGRVGAVSRSAINDLDVVIGGLDRLKAQGVDTGRVLEVSLSKAINTADGEKALETVRAKIEQVRNALGDKVADGLLDQAKKKADELADAMDKARPGINSVREAMKELGIVTDETLRKTAADARQAYEALKASGTASARELALGFEAAANRAIAANKGIAPSWVEAEAAASGYRVMVDEAGKATLRLSDATEKTSNAHVRATQSVNNHRTALEKLNAEREREIATQEKANQLKEREIALYLKKWNMDSQHRSLDAEGKVREEVGMPSKKGIYDRAKTAGLSDDKAVDFADSFDTNLLKTKGSRGTPVINLQRLDDSIAEAVLASARRGTAAAAPQQNVGTYSASPSVVNITLDGRSRSVTTDAAGASVLQDLLEQLALGRSTASR